MTTDPDCAVPREAYRSLGLVGNPFRAPRRDDSHDQPHVGLVTHAAAMRLLAALDRAAASPDPEVVWVEKSSDLPGEYFLLSLAQILKVLVQEADFGFLPAYVPLQLMKVGRIRSTLMVSAEHLTGRGFGLTLAAYAADVLAEPDTDLPEYGAVAPWLEGIRDWLESDPEAAAVGLFGPETFERAPDPAAELERTARDSAARRRFLETDPAEDAQTEESDEPETPAEDARAASEDDLAREALLAYLVASTRAHLSPVVARAIAAYVAHGTYAAGEELKVTKAPRKTLGALVRFARHRYRRVTALYDRFDSWQLIEPDLRAKIAGSLTEMRWSGGDGLVMVFLARPGEAPELETQFGGTRLRVAWDMPWLGRLETDTSFSEEVVRDLVSSAAVEEGAADRLLAGEGYERLVAACGDDIVRFCALAADAVDDAIGRGVGSIDTDAADAAMAVERTG